MVSNGSERTAGTGDRPVVGLTTYLERARRGEWDEVFALVTDTYLRMVTAAGGVAVLLPPQPAGAAALVERVDAVVLTGGADVDPARYGAVAGPRTASQPARDAWEVAVLAAALAASRPVLAICRGLQVLNVACGGTLHQHLPDVVGHDAHSPAPGAFGTVAVSCEPGSRLHAILGPATTVPCHHHQAIDRLGAGLRVTARAADGTVEAAELPGRGFVIGVQWHPEENLSDLRLARELVRSAVGPRPARVRSAEGSYA